MTSYSDWRGKLSEALDPRFYTVEWLDRQVAQGRALLWADEAAVILAELRFYPTGACDLHGLVAAGDMTTIVGKLIPQAEAWARTAGCVGAIIESREGWGRVLKGRGYSLYQSAYRKDL